MRLFASVDVPDDLVESIETLQKDFADASGLNFTDPTQAHVTLKFFGEVPEAELDVVSGVIENGVEDAGVEPFEASLGGLGVFPSLEYISVVWLGFEAGGRELCRLHEAIEKRAVAAGFDPEEHEFTPHVTLARMEHAGGKELVQDLVSEHDPDVGQFRVDEVRLKESDLRTDGPEYSTLEQFEL